MLFLAINGSGSPPGQPKVHTHILIFCHVGDFPLTKNMFCILT